MKNPQLLCADGPGKEYFIIEIDQPAENPGKGEKERTEKNTVFKGTDRAQEPA